MVAILLGQTNNEYFLDLVLCLVKIGNERVILGLAMFIFKLSVLSIGHVRIKNNKSHEQVYFNLSDEGILV